jgi:trehalose-6-phosphate synthase
MKITLRIVLSITLVIAAVAGSFSYWQAQQEKVRLKNELERRASLIADGLSGSLLPLLERNAEEPTARLLNRFSNRERVIGAAVHDAQGKLITASTGLERLLRDQPEALSPVLQETERLGAEHGAFVALGRQNLHAYTVPLGVSETQKFTLTLFHDRDYIDERVNRIWINSFWRALIQSLLVALTTLIMIYLSVTAPIRRATDWLRRVRRGDAAGRLPKRDRILLGPLADEISKIAKNLEAARLTAEREARLRQSTESLWTAERLKAWVQEKLGGRTLFVLSNREPYMHLRKSSGGPVECIVPASGLVTAIEPVLKACGGTWVAQATGNADREHCDKKGRLRVPPEEPAYSLRRVWVDEKDQQGFYFGFSNEGLWPLCHIAHTRPVFRPEDWTAYQRVNQLFADALCEEMEDTVDPCVLVQDYHFALVPRMIKEKRPDARVSIFWHIPWSNPESFGICPWRRELLQGMLGADIIGFHTQFHCNNFIESVDRFLESRIDYEHFTVHREGQTTLVKPFPISIAEFSEGDPSLSGPRPEPADANKDLLKPYGISAEFIGVGVDRLDYTKGIAERFRAIEYFLDQNRSYRGRFTFVEIGAPSRGEIPKYAEISDEITREAERINAKFKTAHWMPILFLKKYHSQKEIRPFYRRAQVCMVTSLHDGMNLVAKEYVASCADGRGALILSQFTGAARDLTDALIVNPYDISQMAEAIKTALEMPVSEQEERMGRMRAAVKERNIYRWAADMVGGLTQVRLPHETRPL